MCAKWQRRSRYSLAYTNSCHAPLNVSDLVRECFATLEDTSVALGGCARGSHMTIMMFRADTRRDEGEYHVDVVEDQNMSFGESCLSHVGQPT